MIRVACLRKLGQCSITISTKLFCEEALANWSHMNTYHYMSTCFDITESKTRALSMFWSTCFGTTESKCMIPLLVTVHCYTRPNKQAGLTARNQATISHCIEQHRNQASKGRRR
uniref:Uncharacterized protein n=1 Tax=Arundo donax TaxID=35708 RepID=A0A0A9DNC6_ARUDO